MCETMGLQNGEAAICAAMEDLAILLNGVHEAWDKCDLDTLHPAARQIAGIADRIGLQTLSAVASDVANLRASQDDTALAATVARLVRLGERSLIAIWEAQDVSV